MKISNDYIKKILISTTSILVIFLIFYFYNLQKSEMVLGAEKIEEKNETVLLPEHIGSRIIPPSYRHYWNTNYQFSIFYKNIFRVKEYPEDNRSITIVFQDSENLDGFQIYITPYFSDKITDEQFIKDIPSGVRKNEQKIFVDKKEAVAFISEDQNLGETLEVWFINYGLLYEITANKGSEQLVRDIVSSWRFY